MKIPLLQPVSPGAPPRLDDAAARPPGDLPDRAALRAELIRLAERLTKLQRALYAERTRSLLVVLQARDGGGKDGTIRRVFGPLNPQGCTVAVFDRPTVDELAHDYLWRVHAAAPPRGTITVFNRSHYEDVLAVRVGGLAPREVWERRFDHINAFERMLADEGTTIVKFFLHISPDEQRRRLRERMDDPAKNWKFDPSDLDARAHWDDYTVAYADALGRCSTAWAPWYVVPADDKALRDVLVARVVVDTLERMSPRFPAAHPELLRLREQL